MYINDNNKKNYEYLFSLKMMILSNICAILVVFIHAYNIDTYNVNNFFIENFEIFISKFLGQIAVPFFLLVVLFGPIAKKENLDLFLKINLDHLLSHIYYGIYFIWFFLPPFLM